MLLPGSRFVSFSEQLMRNAVFAGQVHTQKISFIRNKAERNGGGMCLVESLASGSVTLQQSYFEENIARRGGGLFMDSIASLLVRGPDTKYVVFHK